MQADMPACQVARVLHPVLVLPADPHRPAVLMQYTGRWLG
jgi:hypothetical protein